MCRGRYVSRGPLMLCKQLPRRELLHRRRVCIHAIGDHLVPAGQAHRRQRRRERQFRQLGGRLRADRGSGRPRRRSGIRVHPVGDHLVPAGQAHRRGGRVRRLGSPVRAHRSGGRAGQERGHGSGVRIREGVAQPDPAIPNQSGSRGSDDLHPPPAPAGLGPPLCSCETVGWARSGGGVTGRVTGRCGALSGRPAPQRPAGSWSAEVPAAGVGYWRAGR